MHLALAQYKKGEAEKWLPINTSVPEVSLAGWFSDDDIRHRVIGGESQSGKGIPMIRTLLVKPFRKMTGLLKLKPAGSSGESRYGLLKGAILLTKGEGPAADAESAFEGTLRAVLTNPRSGSDVQSLRGVIDGFYIYRIRGDNPMPLRVAIESRPE